MVLARKLDRNVKGLFLRNRIPFCDYRRKLDVVNGVGLHWFSLERLDGRENFGDALSPFIVEAMLKEHGKEINREKGKASRHLYAVGSILLFGYQKAVVWGSGMLTEAIGFRDPRIYQLDIRAVRGPLTRKSLVCRGFHCPEVYGDPAVLLPVLYQPRVSQVADRRIAVIEHKNSLSSHLDDCRLSYIDIVTDDVFSTIDQICSSRLVISSSLHGIIVAEAYGIPAILVNDYVGYNEFKYKDWYYSTGRSFFPVAGSVEEALTMQAPVLPDLRIMQESLWKTFPSDLFY